MIPCSAAEICRAVGGTLLQDADAAVTNVSTDSRTIAAGDLFIPLVGEKFDGHAYLDGALARGAAGCLTMRAPAQLQPGKFYILVDDTLLALRALASWYRGRFTLPVVQITGSAGKTTTKEMVAAVLAQRFETLKTEANYNNHIGAPLTLLRLTPEHRAAVIETGMNHFGEIRYLGEMVRPDIAVITNVGDAHIENLGGTRAGTLRAKSEIFENLSPDGIAVLNGDDELLHTVTLPQRIIRCGKGENCDVRVTDIADRGLEGLSCTVRTAKAAYPLEIPSPGAYMIYPAAMAAAIGEYLGLTAEEIVRGVAAYVPTGSRMHLIRRPENRLIIDDCYNANPSSMRASVGNFLAEPLEERQRRVLILGDMLELGDWSEREHAAIIEMAAQDPEAELLLVGPEFAKAYDGLAEKPANVTLCPTRDDLISLLKVSPVEHSLVLVKGSHGMGLEQALEAL